MKTTSDFLVEVVNRKRSRLAEAMNARRLETMRNDAYERRTNSASHALRNALKDDGTTKVIAEIKKTSPSKGKLRSDDIRPETLACSYARAGAIAISVLTEEDYFCGSLTDLTRVRESVSLPILRKDFVVDEYQVYESAAAGADAVLLITALLAAEQLAKLRSIAEDELGMDALVEVHDRLEMDQAEAAGATLIGVNNRNLRSFEVSLDVSFELAALKPLNATLISESGIRSGEQIKRLRALGYGGFLIGEKLITSDDPERDLKSLIREAQE